MTAELQNLAQILFRDPAQRGKGSQHSTTGKWVLERIKYSMFVVPANLDKVVMITSVISGWESLV